MNENNGNIQKNPHLGGDGAALSLLPQLYLRSSRQEQEPDRPTGGKPQSNLNLPGRRGSGVEQCELTACGVDEGAARLQRFRGATTAHRAYKSTLHGRMTKRTLTVDNLKRIPTSRNYFLAGFWVNDHPD